LKENSFSDNRIGISLSHVNDCKITNNKSEANVEQAILLISNQGVMLTDNTMKNNTADVIESAGA
jgi:parallel beta-helix repeat protein